MKKIITLLLIFALLFSLFGCNNKSSSKSVNSKTTNKTYIQLTMQEKLDDFNYMYEVLKENYPFFEVNKRLTGIDWLANKDKYIEEIKNTKDDYSYIAILDKILGDLKNHHTTILSKDRYIDLKVAYSKYKPWLDELNNEKARTRYLTSNYIDYDFGTSGAYIAAGSSNVKTKIIQKDKAAYLSISSFEHSADQDMGKIKPFLEGIKDYKTLIIDIRGNDGGDSAYWTSYLLPMLISKPVSSKMYFVYRGGSFSEKFLKGYFGNEFDNFIPISNIDKEGLKNMPPEIKSQFKYYDKSDFKIEPRDSVNFKGKIYLLVDKFVYSAAETFATYAKHSGFATLVGETTAGDGIGISPFLCTLPNSGYVFQFSSTMGLAKDGSCDEETKTIPDIKVSAERGTTLEEDEAVKKILSLDAQ